MCQSSAPPPSSTLTTLRALVMLICLVAIPAVALRGTSLGGMLRQFLLEKLDKPKERLAARAELDEAPRFSPAAAGPGVPTATLSIGGSEAGGNPSGLSPRPAMTAGPEAVSPWSPSLPSNSGPPVWENQRETTEVRSPRPETRVGDGAVQTSAEDDRGVARDPIAAPQQTDRFGANLAIPPAPGNISPPAADQARLPGNGVSGWPAVADDARAGRTVDQFLYIQQRLRELGANYYLLENWGDQGECYRFHCRVAVAGNANFTRHFECTDRDPLHAMTRVLGDVEAWRQSSLAWEPQTAMPAEVGRLTTPQGGSGGSPNPGYLR